MSSSDFVMNQAKSAIENSISEVFERFQNEKFGTVRVVMKNNDPWFVAKDPCDCLGYSDTSDACRVLDEDEKCVVSRKELPALFAETSSTPTMTLISESGLYTLILRSNKPEAKSFRKWVTSEVLPSIRKTGEYRIAPSNYAEALRALAAEVEAKEATLKALAEEKEQHEADNRDFREGLDILNSKCSRIQTKQVQTAMTTASIKSRECKRLTNENEDLRDKVGRGQNWRTYSEMIDEWIERFHHKPVINKLKEFCIEIGILPIKDVRETYKVHGGHIRESVVNRYHIDAWKRYEKYEEMLLCED